MKHYLLTVLCSGCVIESEELVQALVLIVITGHIRH